MKVDRTQFMQDGFIILRNVVPPGDLERVRSAVEHMVERRREISQQQRLPGRDHGDWSASAQPRLRFDADCDAESAAALEFLLGATTLGVARQLIDAEEVALHYMACICSSDTQDAGPARWHRDIGAGTPAPLPGMIANMERHGPSYLQWNIALYEDSVFWIVPQSHKRINSAAENRQLADDPSAPLPGGTPVELGPGDGVVYTHLLLHWGSNYTRKLRRTIHPGFRPFNFAAMPNVHWRHWEPGFFHYLSPPARRQFEAWDQRFFAEIDRYAEIFRTIIDGEAAAFQTAFEQVHPSPNERLVTLAMLNQLALRLGASKRGEAASPCFNERDDAYMDGLFTAPQSETLQRRFAALDERMRQPEARQQGSFQGGPSPYLSADMPTDFSMEDFIASWKDDEPN